MRLLIGMGYFTEMARETYKPTPLASAFITSSPYGQAVIHLYVTTTFQLWFHI